MNATAPGNYEIYAFRYATRTAPRSSYFVGGDPHDGPQAMDYFFWLVRGAGRTIVVDTGFTAEVARKRGRRYLASPIDVLARFGVSPDAVKDVVLTHLHYDHAGNLDGFPNARFHLQDDEVAYATGRYMCFHKLRHGYECEDVVRLVRLVYGDRVEFHNGDAELAPGITLHRIGGHTAGLQCLRVRTARGWVVLASDAAHFFEHQAKERLFTTVYHAGEMLEGFRTLARLADSSDHIIPGHDPLVMTKYPHAEEAFRGVVARVDLPPVEP